MEVGLIEYSTKHTTKHSKTISIFYIYRIHAISILQKFSCKNIPVCDCDSLKCYGSATLELGLETGGYDLQSTLVSLNDHLPVGRGDHCTYIQKSYI